MSQISMAPMDSTPSSPTTDARFTFENVRYWKGDQVTNWLHENNFQNYENLFAENDITGDVLLELDHQILKELKINTIGERIRILVAVKSLLKNCINNVGRYQKESQYSNADRSPAPVQLSRSSSLPRSLSRSNSVRTASTETTLRDAPSRENTQTKLPQHAKNASMETIKQHIIKVIGEDHEWRSIDVRGANDAKSILNRVLHKFSINDEVEKYSLFTTISDTETRSLSDEELVKICKSPDRPERDRLILRKKHQPMSHEEFKRQRMNKKLENFFGEKPPTTARGPTQKKLRNFFGQRPPSELISLNLPEFFPGHDTEELERSARNSIRRASRLSKFRRTSRLFDDLPELPGTTITEVEELDEVLEEEEPEIEDEEVPEDWNPDQEFEGSPKWIKGALIGMGSFGSVYLGLNAVTGVLMAVKCVEFPTGNSENEDRKKKSMLDALEREIALLKDLHHENIVRYLGSQHDDKGLNIFLEYVPGGSVATMLNNYGPLKETLVRSFVRQILQGLNYLHEREIIHRDIKGANVLVDNKGGIKISDFGISKKVEDEFMAATSAHRPSLQGSVFWMAPEVVKQVHYSTKADIWSLGCLIVEMFTGDHPFPEFNQMQAIFKIGSSCSPEIPDNISADAKEFLAKTFDSDHERRPAASVLLTHSFAAPSIRSPQPSPM